MCRQVSVTLAAIASFASRRAYIYSLGPNHFSWNRLSDWGHGGVYFKPLSVFLTFGRPSVMEGRNAQPLDKSSPVCVWRCACLTDVVDPKAARCLFDESLIRSMYDLEKYTERGRQTKIKLNIDPPPYGRCCYNRFDPVCHITS